MQLGIILFYDIYSVEKWTEQRKLVVRIQEPKCCMLTGVGEKMFLWSLCKSTVILKQCLKSAQQRNKCYAISGKDVIFSFLNFIFSFN